MRVLVIIVIVYTGVFLAFSIAACAVYFLSSEISLEKKKTILKILVSLIGLPVFFWWFSFISGYVSVTPGGAGFLALCFLLAILIGMRSAGREITDHFFSVVGRFISHRFYKPNLTKGITVTPGKNARPIDPSPVL